MDKLRETMWAMNAVDYSTHPEATTIDTTDEDGNLTTTEITETVLAIELTHKTPDEMYDALFTKDKPIIFAFHGYPTLVHELTYERTNRNLSVHGYQEEGTIATPFDMRVQNEIDRFHLIKDALLHLPQLDNRGAYLIQQMNDKLVAHKNYIHEIGQHMPEILDWKWHLPENK